MINEFVCTNISTQDPAALVTFYHEKLGIPIVFEGYGNYDGAQLGFSEKAPGIIVWNSSNWGQSSESKVEFVFSCDTNLDDMYQELRALGVVTPEPRVAAWGGRELNLFDPDGNKIMILEPSE
ncbi:TPA: VOC family protein [Listeria innocua]|nr:VOC family protein [Listeria innocua]HBM3668498.1 VOC family protein [Listeria innocua]HBM3731934.1 VOC family protein [Listeria innocua]HBM3790443.1 VOC family protein [Listeria innocua]HBM3926160.1 VOC family protein [Listeria innocua]